MYRQRIIGLSIICIFFLIPMLHVHEDAHDSHCETCYTQQYYLDSSLFPNNVSVYVTHAPFIIAQTYISVTNTYCVKRLRAPPLIIA